MELAQLAVFVRPPTSRPVKTRLATRFGDAGAARLYRAFAEDTIALCSRVRAAGRVHLALWSAGSDETVSDWAKRLGTPLRLQPEGDLGVRLTAAFDEGLRDYERVVIIGSDMPTLPIQLIGAAFDSLENNAFTLGPAQDGGYYAIGASRRVRPRFEGVRWSTENALADTVKANAPRRPAMLPPWYDIDEPEDLAVLRAHLSIDSAAAPATASCMAELSRAQR
ncbi:MAG: TIGR04282 family arsenosugar biosynthesis glycosyltransferase [Polyangiales bacterium]